MINIKVKNLKTNSRLSRRMCEKYQSFFQHTGTEAYAKPALEMHALQSLQGQFSGFHFLILFLKTLKLGKFL